MIRCDMLSKRLQLIFIVTLSLAAVVFVACSWQNLAVLFWKQLTPALSNATVVEGTQTQSSSPVAENYDAVEPEENNKPSIKCDAIIEEADENFYCLTADFLPQHDNCLVYSFGARNKELFIEKTLAKDFRCVVRVFGKPSGSFNFSMFSYNYSLGADNRYDAERGGVLYNFATLLDIFGETNRTMDLLKINMELVEMNALESMVERDEFVNIKQIVFEGFTETVNQRIFFEVVDQLEGLGFRNYFHHESQESAENLDDVSHAKSNRQKTQLDRYCCSLLHFINMKYAVTMRDLQIEECSCYETPIL